MAVNECGHESTKVAGFDSLDGDRHMVARLGGAAGPGLAEVGAAAVIGIG